MPGSTARWTSVPTTSDAAVPIATHEFRRTVAGTADEVLARTHRALAAAGFTVTAQAGGLQAKRGSNLVSVTKKLMPIRATATVHPVDAATTVVAVSLADRSGAPIATKVAVRMYQGVFDEVERAIDASLAAPVAWSSPPATGPGTGPPPPTLAAPPTSATPPTAAAPAAPVPFAAAGDEGPTLTEQAGALVARVTETAKAAAVRPGEPWQRVGELVLVRDRPVGDDDPSSIQEMAPVAAGRVAAYLSIDAMVDRQPDSLPAGLRDQLARVVAEVVATMDSAGRHDMDRVRHDLDGGDVPVAEFLHLQSRIREQLPVRTLQRCRDCRHEKVVNPDYQKLLDRNRKIQALTGGVGVAFRGGSMAPFLLVGTLFRLRKTDPDFVCPRCQGMACDESIATFCPECGSLEKGAVLRRCGRCEHDYRSDAPAERFWRPIPSTPWPTAQPTPPS